MSVQSLKIMPVICFSNSLTIGGHISLVNSENLYHESIIETKQPPIREKELT